MDEREYDWLEGGDGLHSGAMTQQPIRVIFTAQTLISGGIAVAMVVAAVFYVLFMRGS
ncbi:hypothetical protein [Mesorhizobium sp. BE184]|uniref:hypothetical protein n=1 Tax=Mesorhizobium sp. BE184 TaxID=2817714 RepID=UPI0028601A61|nr:hypothetical protein [Mesorhizobium sp. BE184]MDR7034473.1 hypothetical protein [Mesorhizobium sp. BE184]